MASPDSEEMQKRCADQALPSLPQPLESFNHELLDSIFDDDKKVPTLCGIVLLLSQASQPSTSLTEPGCRRVGKLLLSAAQFGPVSA